MAINLITHVVWLFSVYLASSSTNVSVLLDVSGLWQVNSTCECLGCLQKAFMGEMIDLWNCITMLHMKWHCFSWLVLKFARLLEWLCLYKAGAQLSPELLSPFFKCKCSLRGRWKSFWLQIKCYVYTAGKNNIINKFIPYDSLTIEMSLTIKVSPLVCGPPFAHATALSVLLYCSARVVSPLGWALCYVSQITLT